MEILTALLITIFTLIIFIVYFNRPGQNGKSYSLPKGPMSLPFVGNVFSMVVDPHLILSQWARKFGPLSTIYFGPRPALLVSDSKLLKELLSKFASTGKFKTDSLLLVSRGSNGVFNTDGKISAELRGFCAKSLKTLGFGTKALEQILLTETRSVINSFEIEARETGKFLPYKVFQRAISNCIWSLVGGKRLHSGGECHEEDQKSETVIQLLDNFIDWLQYSIKSGLAFCSWLKYLAPKWSGYLGLDKSCEDLHEFFKNVFDESQKSFNGASTEPNNLVDCYLTNLKCVTHPKNSVFYGEWGFVNSVATVSEIFIGGVGTTGITLDWMVRYLSLNIMEVQNKLVLEIDEMIGNEREPSLDDKPRLPYTEAVILESHRYSSVLPLGVWHELLEDIEFQGYHLPKGMILVPNLYHIHHNENVWKDPQNFRPERFLEDGGSALKEHMLPFQTGRRVCLGEPLVKDFLFLMVASFFQKFKVRPNTSISRKQYLKPQVGFALMPLQFELLIERRMHSC